VQDSAFDAWPVADGKRFYGMIRHADIARALTLEAKAKTLRELLTATADEGEAESFPHVHPDHSLHVVLEKMGASGLSVLPVVSRADLHELFGIVVLDDVLRAYGLPEQLPRALSPEPS
jgi:CBS domain-containing protein